MDLFKSVFLDDPEASSPQNAPTSPPKSQSDDQEVEQDQPDPRPPSSNPNPSPRASVAAIANAWSFGGLIKTLASKSESVIETYRRDLEEFGAGLRKETSAVREVAGRVVKDLPTALEAGAVVTQDSLESVGQAIDNIGNRVSEIISHGNYSVLEADSGSETSDSEQIGNDQQNLSSNSRLFSRINAQIRAVQCDLNTYCKEPEDLDEYGEWKVGFKMSEKGEEIENFIQENGLIEEIYNEAVPSKVDQETFWSRYFYRVYKVRKTEEARAKLLKSTISGEEEVDLSWDVDDDDYEESDRSKLKNDSEGLIQHKDSLGKFIDNSKIEILEKCLIGENDDAKLASESKIDEKVNLDESEWSGNALEAKSDEKLGLEGKAESGGSSKDSDFSFVSSQPSMAEEEEADLGWDEIEDIGSGDETKVTASGSPNRADLRKRLSAMEEEEDLGWDIEDDDEPVKSSS